MAISMNTIRKNTYRCARSGHVVRLAPGANRDPYPGGTGCFCSCSCAPVASACCFPCGVARGAIARLHDPAQQLNAISKPAAAHPGGAVGFRHHGEPVEAGVCQRSAGGRFVHLEPETDRGHGENARREQPDPVGRGRQLGDLLGFLRCECRQSTEGDSRGAAE